MFKINHKAKRQRTYLRVVLQSRPDSDYLDQCGSSAANEKMTGL